MQRTVVGGGNRPAVNGVAAAKERMADPRWNAPRISMADAAKFAGRDVTFVGTATAVDLGLGTAEFTCVCSGVSVAVYGLPPDAVIATMNEITAYVEAPGRPLLYASHGQLNDDVDVDVYKKLVGLITNHHAELFY